MYGTVGRSPMEHRTLPSRADILGTDFGGYSAVTSFAAVHRPVERGIERARERERES